jgi:NADH-quinone oxidoreductase subunit F
MSDGEAGNDTVSSAADGHLLSGECRGRIQAERLHYPRARAALLPALHLAQEEYGHLPRPVVGEVAALLGLLPIQVQEVVSFYPLFHDRPVGCCHIQVCANIACALAGAHKLVKLVESTLGIRSGEVTPDGRFSLAEVECLGSCGTAPVVQVNNRPYLERASAADIERLLSGTDPAELERAPLNSLIPDGIDGYLLPPNGQTRGSIDEYLTVGGYQAGQRTWREMSPESIVQLVKSSGLRGRGGAGFPTGAKWAFMSQDCSKPRYLAVNGDESEPGTFKDRQILERNPHQFLEGVLIAGRAIRAAAAYVYLRAEYTVAYRVLMDAIAQAYARGFLGDNVVGTGQKFDVYVQRGAGAPREPTIMVTTRLRDSAFKRALRTMALGSEAKLEGPFGNLALYNNAARPAVFLAGGIGVTPFASIAVRAATEG